MVTGSLDIRTIVGTSGFSYSQWRGTFYPPKLPAAQMLQFYGARFATVEINNTFYRMPKVEMLEKWPSQVPSGFTFVLKASQRITHMKRLKDVQSEVDYFFKNAATLGHHLGPVLFQLPPFLRKDVPRLADFLAILPDGVRPAVEFRHESWYDEEVFATLRDHGAALCLSDTEEGSTPLVATADWGYLRLRRCDYTDADLSTWKGRILGQSWKDAFVFFKHEDEATGPKLAADFVTLMASS